MGGCCSGGAAEEPPDQYAELMEEVARRGYRGDLVEGAIVGADGKLLYRVGSPAHLQPRGDVMMQPRRPTAQPYVDCLALLASRDALRTAPDEDAAPPSPGKPLAYPALDTVVHSKGATHLTAVHFMREQYVVILRVAYDCRADLYAVDTAACLESAREELRQLRDALPREWRGGCREESLEPRVEDRDDPEDALSGESGKPDGHGGFSPLAPSDTAFPPGSERQSISLPPTTPLTHRRATLATDIQPEALQSPQCGIGEPAAAPSGAKDDVG